MSARGRFEAELARLNAVALDPTAGDGPEVLSHALSARSNLLVARAAEIIGEWELGRYASELAAAFDRFMEDAAKIAIAETLNRLEVRDADLFARGLRHVQLEPVWGGSEDTAARLRAICALGLARSDPPETLMALAGLLTDGEVDARIGAVRAIAYASRPGAAPLLWYKAHVGDPEPAVIYECFTALLALEPEHALPFVAGRARDEQLAVAEAALLALGSSRRPDALPLLVAALDESVEIVYRRTALKSIAMLGSDDAFACLLDLLANGTESDSASALDALALFREDERRQRKIERVLRRREASKPGQ